MLEHLDNIDKQLLIWLNGFHSPFWDSFMIAVTGKLIWVPLYLALAGFLIYRHGKRFWMPLAVISILIIMTDQTASGIMKPVTGRLRPCHDAEICHMLNFPDGCGGMYGFFSSHASNVFGLAFFFCFMYGEKHRFLYLLLPWATVVSYSRIYLAVHYPGDVLAGLVCGLLYGWIAAWGLSHFMKRGSPDPFTAGSAAS